MNRDVGLRWAAVLASINFGGAMVTSAALAGTVNVQIGASVTGDGKCGLAEAVRAANLGSAVDACTGAEDPSPANPTGHDDVVLGSGTYDIGASGLSIWTSMTLRGNGMRNTTIRSSGGSPAFEMGMGISACADRASAIMVAASMFNPSTGERDLLDVFLTDLTVQQTSGADAQGVCFTDGHLVLERARVMGFLSRGIFAQPAWDRGVWLEVFLSWIDGNRAHNDGIGGAGIYYRNDVGDSGLNFNVKHSAITNNQSDDKAGGIYVGGSAVGGFPIIENTTIANNTARLNGGGIYDDMMSEGDQYLILRNCTISKNTAGMGGSGVGGGVFKRPNSSPDLRFWSTIVSANTANGNSSQASLNQMASGNNATLCAASMIALSGWPAAKLPLGENGTGDSCDYTAPTLLSSSTSGRGGPNNLPVFTFSTSSAAIDRVVNSDLIDDQRQMFRPYDGDTNGVARRDVGSYERHLLQLETEGLDPVTVAGIGSSAHADQSESAASAGQATQFAATGIGQSVTYPVTSLANSTTYRVVIRFKKASNAGNFNLCMASSASGACSQNIITLSAYNPFTQWDTVEVGTITTPSSSGTRYFRFSVTGKDSLSTGHQVTPDFIDFIKQ